ncbi:MAG TPA: hypothetical protein VH394_03350 [Thermoanaerobaculia bacterium]|jgi:hypothetical protein|nr:hypothetical protein [Thermoanaerobaculia bacterium]
MIRKSLLMIPLLLLPLAACDKNDEAPPPATPGTGGGAPGPISSRGEKVGDAPAMGGAAQDGAIDFSVPASWQNEQPANNMRVAQATIPGPGGPGNLVVFYFGPGGGGGVEANIQRWIEQMEVPAGTSPQPETFETNGYKVTWIDVPGTLKPSNMGTGPTTEQPDSRLLGAVVEGPGGPWFFKATGPDSTISAERDNFLTMLKSVKAR